MAKRLRMGRHHGVTIVEHDGEEDRGRLVAVVAMAAPYEVAEALAREICAAVNAARAATEASAVGLPDDVCVCGGRLHPELGCPTYAEWRAAAGREQGVSRSLPRSDPGHFQVADRLLADALFLMQNGERPPGAPVDPAAETWADWARRAEAHLRDHEVREEQR